MSDGLRWQLKSPYLILHIVPAVDWGKVKDNYSAPSLEREGFIHCSLPAQVIRPANALFRGQANLLLLCLDVRKLKPDVIYEDCYEAGEEFPHVYGPINLSAVIEVVPFPTEANGEFLLPTVIQTLNDQLNASI